MSIGMWTKWDGCY